MGWEYLQPCSRVIGLERDNQVPSLAGLRIERHERGVTARRIVELESYIITVGASTLCKDQGVVTVEMNWVRQRCGRLDDDVHPLFFEVGPYFDGEVAGVAGDSVVPVDAAESWVAPLRLEGIAVKSPFEEVGRVGTFADKDVLVDLGCLGTSEHGSDGDELFVRFVDALVSVVAADGVWDASGSRVVHDAFDVSRVVELSACLLIVGAHPVVTRRLVCLDEDIVALTNVDVEDVCLVRHDGNEVGGDNGELVSVDMELEG